MFIIHDGSIDDQIQQTYCTKFGFIRTSDGKMDYDCIDEAVRTVYMYGCCTKSLRLALNFSFTCMLLKLISCVQG